MALNGILNTNAYQGRYLSLEWSATPDISGNYSTISWTLKGAGKASSSYYKAAPFEVWIDGEQVYYSTTRISLYEGTVVASGTKTIWHNTDGTRSFAASVKGAIYSAGINCTGEGSFTLDNIPRAASIYYAPASFNDDENPTITISNPANATIAVYMSFDGTGNTAIYPYTVIDSSTTYFTFWLSNEQRQYIYENCATVNSKDLYFHICTAIGDFYRDTPVKSTVNIVGAAPTLAPVVRDIGDSNGGGSLSLTGNENLFINGFNVAECNSHVQAYKGAWITSQSVVCGDKVLWDGYGTLGFVTSPHFTFTATDSRGNTVSRTITVNWINYIPLTCGLSISNPDTNGVAKMSVSGYFWNGNFGAVDNHLELYYRLKEGNGEYSDWYDISYSAIKDTVNQTYYYESDLDGLDYRQSYTIQAVAVDKIYTYPDNPAYSTEVKIKTQPVFDWSETDFNFNVPVTAPAFKGQHKILWEGALYMTADQTAYLNEAISAQANGVVLIFSAYDSANSTPLNYHFNYHYIPKIQPSIMPNANSAFTMSGDGSYYYVGTKELYLGDTYISGNDNNGLNSTNTTSGITFHNAHWVLRYVIGV